MINNLQEGNAIMSGTINSNQVLADLAATPSYGARSRSGNWFEAFANAWGSALDTQAAKIEVQAANITETGMDKPSDITKLTAESMRLSFMANSSHTSLDSVSKALETMARKG